MTSSAAAPFLPHFPDTVPGRESASRRWVRWALIFAAWTVVRSVAGPSHEGHAQRHDLVVGGRDLHRSRVVLGAAHAQASFGSSAASRTRTSAGSVALAAHAVIAPAVALIVTMVRNRLTVALSPLDVGQLLPSYVYWLDVNVLTYAMVVVAAWALGLHRQYRDRTVRTHMLEVQLARAQLQFLGLQLQPHFLFNCLNAISELAHEAPVAAERMLRQLHTLLRLVARACGPG